METIETEVFSQASNRAIIRMPGRRFPGCVIQGDSLSILADLAESVYERVKESSDEELVDEAAELKDLLLGYLLHYETVLEEHGLELPYPRSKE
jgi:hypothetical protein